MKICLVAGARPNFIKLSSIVNAIKGDATLIGQARLYSLNPKDSAYSAAKSQWNAYVYDVQLYTKLVLNDNVTTAELPQSGVIRGLNRGAIGYANAAGSGTTVMLSQVSGRFIVGEQISINGINYSRSIVQVTTYGDEDISKSVATICVIFSGKINYTNMNTMSLGFVPHFSQKGNIFIFHRPIYCKFGS